MFLQFIFEVIFILFMRFYLVIDGVYIFVFLVRNLGFNGDIGQNDRNNKNIFALLSLFF